MLQFLTVNQIKQLIAAAIKNFYVVKTMVSVCCLFQLQFVIFSAVC